MEEGVYHVNTWWEVFYSWYVRTEVWRNCQEASAWSRVRNAVLGTAQEGVLHEALRERGGAHKRLVTFGGGG